ncbi:MATE family efflux transporter [Coraliomargarita sp. SDUM461004]|uniref:Multidrug-efflux transporter n=1 Tax=Thalassobacterium sedimentorum TaxID=3041258 RepID=A0ABU1AFM7_9BACT|nr:MATE family efflux transporter [Coraliomargarita sp. SDUM461004]MDQ8193477.1 MATE family efflux transporter [Coraliomargarita sp. SDUM461004]
MHTLFQENRKTLLLALPLIAGQLSQMLLGLTDTLMVGRVGTVDLAAAAFGNALLHLPFSFAIGLSIAVSIQVAHWFGRGQLRDAGEALRNGLFISVLLAIALMALVCFSIPFLGYLDPPDAVLAIVPPYLYWIGFSFLAMVPTMVIKSFAEAQSEPWMVLWIQLGGVVLNIALNAIFIFGYLGMPSMGLTGAGVATCLARFITLGALFYYLFNSRRLAAALPPLWWRRPERTECRALTKMASPLSGQLLIEIGAFTVSAFLIGQFGATALAAHQIALTCAMTTFMLPLGLSMAVTIRVSHAVSAAQALRCRQIVLGAQCMGIMIMLSCALVYVFLGDRIAAGFTEDLEVVRVTVSILAVVAIFQLLDGIQVISGAALRGMRDVNFPTGILFACFWLIAIPLGAVLGFWASFGALGIWSGLAIGLALASVALSIRLWRKLKCF